MKQRLNSSILGASNNLTKQPTHTYQMQSCNAEHHQDMKHKEMSNKGICHKTYTTTGYITLGLCKVNANRTTIIKYKNYAKNTKHSSNTNPWKNSKESTTECLKNLHWLPIQKRIDYKICTLIYKYHKGKAPSYLQNLIQEKKKQTIPDLYQKTTKMFKQSHTQESTLLPADHSVPIVQIYGTHYQTESEKKSTLKNFKQYLKHIFSQLYACKVLSIMIGIPLSAIPNQQLLLLCLVNTH